MRFAGNAGSAQAPRQNPATDHVAAPLPLAFPGRLRAMRAYPTRRRNCRNFETSGAFSFDQFFL
jgi:hypothetical protein